ncbi:MAG: 3-oxoacyl-[acyl-carrier-protein] synthase III [Candidatus Peregrinibacteria bacterium Greene0416_19]|nr:MAG: 3-oxoacyl-[acyl-carrier-protein] synthase III [Candidatus Peregrinibacteria bacterium Greene0416_19]
MGFTRFVEYLPGDPVPNDALPIRFPDIRERTGIEARHFAGPGDTIESMAVEASRRLFDALNIDGNDCSGLVLATSCVPNKDKAVRAMAVRVARVLGIDAASAEGVNFACSGFPKAVSVALERAHPRDAGRRRGADRHTLVIASERMHDLVDFSDESTAILFGDGAAATSLSPDGPHTILQAKAWEVEDCDCLIELKPALAMDIDGSVRSRHCVHMKGGPLYVDAPVSMFRIVREMMEEQRHSIAELGMIAHHQANGKFAKKLEKLRKRNGWDHVRVLDGIGRRGNVASASIPAVLAQFEQELPAGMIVACPTKGAGPDLRRGSLTEGIVLFRARGGFNLRAAAG